MRLPERLKAWIPPARRSPASGRAAQYIVHANGSREKRRAVVGGRVKVLIPVFPGTNCEYDTARAFEKAGADAEIFVVNNLAARVLRRA